jgi:hypothetical protein
MPQLLTDCCVTASSDGSTVGSRALQLIIRYFDHRFPHYVPPQNVRILDRRRMMRPQHSLDALMSDRRKSKVFS